MLSLLKFLIAVAPIASLAECSEGSCMQPEDETSLMQTQVKIKAHQRQPETTTETQTQTVTETEYVTEDVPVESNMYNPVEMNQSYYKAAYLKNSVAKYASARARYNKLKARYNEMQANYKAEGKDFKNSDAGRSLTKALMFADNEMAAWKLAGDAYNRSGEALKTYTDDYQGKTNALYNITAKEDNATAELEKAQQNYSKVKVEAQREVDRAAARYSAKLAYEARVAAAEAIATYKNATTKAKAADKAAKAANKVSAKRKKLAVKTDLAAAKQAQKTLAKAQKAEASTVDEQLANSVQISPDVFSWADNVR